MDNLIVGGVDYRVDSDLAEQVDKTILATYDNCYLYKYDNFNSLIDEIRFDLVERFRPTSILDFGCGNSSFLKYCRAKGECDLYGYDIVNYKNPFYVTDFTISTDVVCFFDSLEHLQDPLATISKLNCQHLLISVPWCRFPLDKDYFFNWKHRRPGEHFWHFNQVSLSRILKPYGFDLQFFGNYEDIVRVDKDNSPNILTCGFSR